MHYNLPTLNFQHSTLNKTFWACPLLSSGSGPMLQSFWRGVCLALSRLPFQHPPLAYRQKGFPRRSLRRTDAPGFYFFTLYRTDLADPFRNTIHKRAKTVRRIRPTPAAPTKPPWCVPEGTGTKRPRRNPTMARPVSVLMAILIGKEKREEGFEE
jgi:hypothetical protein